MLFSTGLTTCQSLRPSSSYGYTSVSAHIRLISNGPTSNQNLQHGLFRWKSSPHTRGCRYILTYQLPSLKSNGSLMNSSTDLTTLSSGHGICKCGGQGWERKPFEHLLLAFTSLAAKLLTVQIGRASCRESV